MHLFIVDHLGGKFDRELFEVETTKLKSTNINWYPTRNYILHAVALLSPMLVVYVRLENFKIA